VERGPGPALIWRKRPEQAGERSEINEELKSPEPLDFRKSISYAEFSMISGIHSSSLRSLRILTSILMLSGCAGSALSKFDHSQELPQDVPKDYYEKFEVKETKQTEPSPVTVVAEPKPVLSDHPTPPKKKRSRKRSKAIEARDEALAKIGPPMKVALVYRDLRPADSFEPMAVGEKLTYEVTYLGLAAGTAVMEILPYKTMNDRKVYHVEMTARTSNVFSLVYHLEDRFETFIDYQSIFSQRFHMHLDETKQIRDSLELYDSENNQSFWWNRWTRINGKEQSYEEKKEFHYMDVFPQDSLSAIYYLRFATFPKEGEIRFNIESEAKPLDASLTVVKREEFDTPAGRVQTIKFEFNAATRGALERKGKVYFWVTDDNRRLLVRIEGKVKIGSIMINLKKIETGTPQP
jgi:hypothetical protein